MATNIKTISNTYPIISFQDILQPTWGDDAGRNTNNAKFTGTFVGYITDLHIEVGPMTKTEMTAFKTIFEVPIIEVTYPDSRTGTDKTEKFYGTALTAKTEYWDGKYEPFSFDLKGVAIRNDV